MSRGIPPAGHVGLSDGETSKQVEKGVEVSGADSSQLHVWCHGNCHHTCTICNTGFSHIESGDASQGGGCGIVGEEGVGHHCWTEE